MMNDNGLLKLKFCFQCDYVIVGSLALGYLEYCAQDDNLILLPCFY